MRFLTGLTVLLIYQLVGEVVVISFGLAVPGPVVGMLLLFLTLLVRPRSEPTLGEVATPILRHLPLLFVPAGVGVIVHLRRIGDEWLPLGAALLLSTVITMAVTALVMSAARRFITKEGSR
jgi:holin-like protein